MRTKLKNKASGFTIIEMVLYTSLLSILLFIFTDVFASILQVRLESEATSSVEQDGRFLIARLAYDIHRAGSVSVPQGLGQQSSTLQISVNTIDYSYGLTNGDIFITTNATSTKLNSAQTSLSTLSFKRIGNTGGKNTVQIVITLKSKTVKRPGTEVKAFQTTVGIR